MDADKIKELIDLFEKAAITELEFEEEGFKLRLKKAAPMPETIEGMPVPAQTAGTAPIPAEASPAPVNQAAPKDDGSAEIVSPMVGIYYRASSPDTPPFVEIGDKVDPKTTVCIIEAMKIMNEIKAELSGTITDALAENGQPVEYGQPLFRVKKA